MSELWVEFPARNALRLWQELPAPKLNGFDDFDECMIYIAENYAWNANSDGAKFLMELLERKFA